MVETTGEHPFYVSGKGFVQAKDLGIGTSLVTRAGPQVQVVGIARKEQPATVYNFTVEETHTYFVGASGGGCWVHNKLPDPPISMDEAVDLAAEHAGDGARMVPTGDGSNYQFIGEEFTNAAGDRQRNIARFDVNPTRGNGAGRPHLNREVQINDVPQRHLDPHTPIDFGTVRPGDFLP